MSLDGRRIDSLTGSARTDAFRGLAMVFQKIHLVPRRTVLANVCAGGFARLGAWASKQSRPLASRGALMVEVAKVTAAHGLNPARPPFWGGYRLTPLEIEFWADGAHRLHDRFRWTRPAAGAPWSVARLNP